MDASWDTLIGQRAGHRCEYCHFPEQLAEVPFQIDHVVARQHGGPTNPENLALACCYCNRYKGPNLAGVDPLSKAVTRLFDPRHDRWESHFVWDGAVLVGEPQLDERPFRRSASTGLTQWLSANCSWPKGCIRTSPAFHRPS